MPTFLQYPNHVLTQNLLAQVTVVDADHGDCNIIDMYQFAPGLEGEFTTSLVRRSLIDTGPTKGAITNAIMHALEDRALPIAQSLPASSSIVPPLSELQITHSDLDHIGNAVAVLKKLQPAMLPLANQPLIVRYSDIPPAMPTIKAQFIDAAVVDSAFRFDFKLDGLALWIERLSEIDLVPHFSTAEASLAITDGPAPVRLTGVIGTSRRHNGSEIISYEIDIDVIQDLVTYINTNQVGGKFKIGFTCGIEDTVNEQLGATRNVLNHTVLMELPLELTLEWLLIFIGVAESQKIFAKNPLTQVPARASAIWKPNFAVVTKRIAELEEALSTVAISDRILHERPLYDQKITRRRVNRALANETDITQAVVGPMSDVYRLRKRYDVLVHLEAKLPLNDKDESEYEDIIYEADNEQKILNRASVVTVFGRHEANFDMLFTGDAYDQEADIRNSIALWKAGFVSKGALFKFSVMKIPHHGSERTTHAQFYQAVRADVYIVCAQHSTHGNPRVSSLQAIVEGFENNHRQNGGNYRLFFSDPDSLIDTATRNSPLKRLLQMRDYQPGDRLRYEVWVLKPSLTPATRQSYGSILFYRDANNGFPSEVFLDDEWVQWAGPPPFQAPSFPP